MRIAFLINGMTGYLDAQYRQLHALGHELLIVTPVSAALGEAMADTEFRLFPEQYAQVQRWHEPPVPATLCKLVEKFRPDAVVMTEWNHCAAYRAVMKSVPSVVVRLMYMDNLWRATPRQWLGRATHRWYISPVADAVMVPSDRTEFYARRLGFAPEDVVRGAVSADVEMFRSAPRPADELARRRAFLYVGRLVWHKGADVLAGAYERYRKLCDEQGAEPWDLHVVGLGPMADVVRGVPGVTMHGFKDPPQVAELMRSVSCLLLTSHIEPYGVVVHEAACAGLPILCSDFAGAAPGLVQDGYNGWVVAAGRVPLWAAAMVRMSQLPPDRLAAMSKASQALATRISSTGWARNLTEEIERRRAGGGGRLADLH